MNAADRPQQRFLALDDICDRFEEAWQAGNSPKLEKYLAQASISDRPTLFGDLAMVELRYRYRRGERLRLSEYQNRFPEQKQVLASLFKEIRASKETLAEKKVAQLSDTKQVDVGNAFEALTVSPGPMKTQLVDAFDELGTEFGDYELLEEIGRGGMGVVFRARQKSLDREVALKMILGGSLADQEAVDRFYAEAQAVGQLRHPNIVAVHEVGKHQGHHFFSMDYIEGQSLSELARSRPLQANEVAAYVQTVAEAVHCAHEAGIVHRDLKPANILIDSMAQPLVTDFGLAKRTDDEEGLTSTGRIMGTPSYMPPEQIDMSEDAIGPASDVYALGAILYELFTGRPPFRGESSMETLMQVLEQEPVAPRMLTPKLALDLETITLKCLQKDPSRRYASASALAEELARYLSGKPILARPVTWMERSWRWCKRRPRIALLTAMVGVLLTILSVGGPTVAIWQRQNARKQAWLRAQSEDYAKRVEREKKEQEKLRTAAETYAAMAIKQKERSDRNLYVASMRLAGQSWDTNNLQLFQRLLDRYKPTEQADEKLQNFEWYYLKRLNRNGIRTIFGHASGILDLEVSSDQKWMVSAGDDGVIKLWDAKTGVLLRQLTGHRGQVKDVAISPNADWLVSAGLDGSLRMWRMSSGRELPLLWKDELPLLHVLVSGDGKQIAAGGVSGTIRLYDAATRELLREFSLQGEVSAMSIRPDGKHLAAAGSKDKIKVWELATGKEVTPPSVSQSVSGIRLVKYSPNGEYCVISSIDAVNLWDATTGEIVYSLPTVQTGSKTVAFTENGQRIAYGADKQLRVWDAAAHKILLNRKGHTGEISAVAFVDDETQIVTASFDGMIKYWRTISGNQDLIREGTQASIRQIAFGRGGHRVFATDSRGRLLSWYWRQKKGMQVLTKGKPRAWDGIAVSPDADWLVTGSNDGKIRLWDVNSGEEKSTFAGHKGAVFGVAVSPNGQLVASGGNDRLVKIWDVKSGQLKHVLRGSEGTVARLKFSPDGKWLASSQMFGPPLNAKIRLWEVSTGRRVHTLTGWGQVGFSPDGKLLAVPSREKIVRIFEVRSGNLVRSLRGHNSFITAAVFTPDGNRLATADNDDGIKLWDSVTWQEILSLKTRVARSLEFSPDGSVLAVGQSEAFGLGVFDGRP